MNNPDGEPFVTTGEMLAQARRLEPTITSRGLEEFRTQGLMPSAQRIGQQGKRPIYGYPASAARQLDALLQWRHVEKNPDWLRVLMWVDGWPIDLPRAHASMIKLIRVMRDELARVGLVGDPAAVAEAARSLANRRGKNTPIPRRRGVSVQQRAQTIEGILDSFLTDHAVAGNDPHADQMLTAMGVDSRKAARNNLPTFTLAESPDPVFGDPNIVHVDRLVEAIETASEAELRNAQRAANLMVVRMPITAALIKAMTGGSGTPIDILAPSRDQPGAYLLSVAFVIALDRAGLTGLKEIGTELAHLDDVINNLKIVAEMDPEQLRANLASTPGGLATLRRFLANIPLAELDATYQRQGPRTR
jgi:hypothetical protein